MDGFNLIVTVEAALIPPAGANVELARGVVNDTVLLAAEMSAEL